jgi:hypothetical protein
MSRVLSAAFKKQEIIIDSETNMVNTDSDQT